MGPGFQKIAKIEANILLTDFSSATSLLELHPLAPYADYAAHECQIALTKQRKI